MHNRKILPSLIGNRSKPELLLMMLIVLSCSKDNKPIEDNSYPEPSGELIVNFPDSQLTLDLNTKSIQTDGAKTYNHVTESQESLYMVDRANQVLRAFSKSNMDLMWTFSPEPGVNEEIRFTNSEAHYDGQANSVYLHYRIVNLNTFASTYKTVKLSAETGAPQVTLSPDRETHYHTTLGNNYCYLDRMGTDNSTWLLNKRNKIMLNNHESIAIDRFPRYLGTHDQSLVVIYSNGDIVAYNDALTQIWDAQTGGANNSDVERNNDHMYVSSKNNKITGVNLNTGEIEFSADTGYDRAAPVGADGQGIYLLDADTNNITVKKYTGNGNIVWETPLDNNLTSESRFMMKGVALTDHLLLVVASENSDETNNTDIFLIQKNNGSEIWKISHESSSSNINNLLVNAANTYFYTN